MQAINRKLLRDLVRLRGQVVAIALVVACGIASFVTTMSTYESLRNAQATYYEQYRFAQVFAQLKRAPDALEPRLSRLPGVARVQTRVVVDVTLDVPGLPEPATGRLISIPEHPTRMLNDLYLRRGRYIAAERRDEVLISEPFATANGLALGDMVGAVINGRWERLRIVGIALSPEYIYEIRGGGDVLPDNRRFGVLWMGRNALGTAFDMQGAFNSVTLTLQPGVREEVVIAALDRLLERYGGLGAAGRADQVSHRFLSDDLAQLKVNATIVPSIFLGVAAFLLHVVLSRLVSTQRDQIAILKAFGYSNRIIGAHYLQFVVLIICVGAVLGAALGLWGGQALTGVYALFYHIPVLRYEASLRLVVLAVLVCGSAAVFGALVAVRGAVRLPPAEAMRPEAPTHFRATVIERLGFGRLLSPVGQMILRHIERKPVQASLSVLGLALATAILVVGGFNRDAINRMIDVQFQRVQREDITVTFIEPRPARARYEVARLPGVLRAEPYRSVAARVRVGHRSRRVGLTGFSAGAELRQLVDRHLQARDLPPDGVVLTSKLADILRVAPGQTVTVDVLEGDRPTRQLLVVGVIDELIGLSAYMDIGALNRLLQEDATISGAYLAVDPQQAPRLYTLLKRVPAVAGVSLRQAARLSFEQSTAKSLKVFTTILAVFASVITFGVVYNAARIALSERGRELASLRVLGFTRAEIAVILLGEQVLLTCMAIPLGWLIGYGLCVLVSQGYDSELLRIPLVVTPATYAFAFLVVAGAGVISGLIVRRRLDHLDLIAVLKTRE
jgi:putative ABC transport system permease protein